MQKYFKFTIVQWNEYSSNWKDRPLGYPNDEYGIVENYMGYVPALIFSNNVLVILWIYDWQAGEVFIDINGYKAPNLYGRDIFNFVIGSNGNLYPMYGSDTAMMASQKPLESNDFYWRNDNEFCGDPNSSNIDGATGLGCAARIIENGWKMDY